MVYQNLPFLRDLRFSLVKRASTGTLHICTHIHNKFIRNHSNFSYCLIFKCNWKSRKSELNPNYSKENMR